MCCVVLCSVVIKCVTYFEVFECLLCDQLLLLVPLHSVHQARPQQANHSRLLELIPLHLLLHIHHDLNRHTHACTHTHTPSYTYRS